MHEKKITTYTYNKQPSSTYIPSWFFGREKKERKKEKLTSDLHIHNSNYNSETKPVLASKSRSQEK